MGADPDAALPGQGRALHSGQVRCGPLRFPGSGNARCPPAIAPSGSLRHGLLRFGGDLLRRWAAWASLAVLYFLRVWMVKGFYIVTYSLGIYNLDLLAAFVTPKFLPVPVEAQDDGPTLRESARALSRPLPQMPAQP